MKTLLPALFFVFTASVAMSQGTVRGKVTNNLGETIPGAAVVVKDNTSLGAYTDIDGDYSIKIPDASPQILVLNYLGYMPQEITVNPTGGEVVIVNFDLVPEDFVITGVTVEAKAIKRNDYYMEKMKQKSATTLDYISAETIKKTGDSNVSSAIKRVTGVSFVGNYVTVRGLADRYIKTTINGSRIPTLDPFTNNIKLDIFPTGLIDNLIITKSASPELPGDWSGAYLSVETIDFPDQLTIQLNSSWGYNPQTTFRDIVSSQGSSTDWLGYDNGFRGIPDGVPTGQEDFPVAITNPDYYMQFQELGLGSYLNSYGITSNTNITEGDAFYNLAMIELGLLGPAQFYNSSAVNQAIGNYQDQYQPIFFPKFNAELADIGQKFSNSWATQTKKAPLNSGNSIIIGNQVNFLKRKLGFMIGVRHSTNVNYDGNSTAQRTNASPDFGASPEVPSPIADDLNLSQQSASETNSVSGLANLSYQLNKNNSVSLLFMPNFIGDNQARKFQGKDRDSGPSETLLGEDQYYEERKQLVYQLKTEHFFPGSKIKADINASYTDGERNVLDFKDIQYFYDAGVYQFRSTFTPNRRFREMLESLFDSRAVVEIPIGKKEANTTKLKLGGAYQYNSRDNSQAIYSLQGVGGSIITSSLSDLFSLDRFSIDGRTTFDLSYANASSLLDSDIGISKVTAGFVMADHHFGSKLRMVGGVRAEHTNIIADIKEYHELGLPIDDPDRRNIGGVKANPGMVDTLHILPSANLIYNLVGNDTTTVNVRLNYFRSLARPGFRELSAVSLEDYELRARVQGNPSLEMTNVNNYDFRIESYFQTGDNLSFSLFYKTFENHIELVKLSGGDNYTWQNADKSSALGLELEGRKKLTSNVDLRANVSFIDSKTTVTVPVNETRKMFGQAPYIVNGILSYTGDSAKFSVSVSYNVQGPKLAVVANAAEDTPDIFELPRQLLDLNITKKIGKHYSASFQVRNLLNAPIRRTYKFDAGWLLDFDKYTYGTNYVLSVSYKL
ncbi:MAG: outer membrane beta-barrel protein [Flavobacteriales bacterium]|nr:outer membrane beta-barrel protein [Flavobacteriales bacterium]